MAGKEQHHVWRMLQRGFGEKRGKEYHPWVYRRGAEPKQKGSGNFGVEKYFYGPEGSEADTVITNFENSVQGDIQAARRMDHGARLDAAFVAPLIAHLEIRSSFLRSELSDLTDRMLAALNEHFGSTKKVRAMMKDYLKKNPEETDAFLAKNFVPVDQRAEMSKLIDAYIDNLPEGTAASLFGGKISELFEMARLVPDGIRDTHNKSIIAVRSDSPRVKALERFSYNIYRPTEGQLILPDTCLAFVGAENAAPFSQPKDGMHSVIVPISSQVAIVGRRNEQGPFELKTINRILAGCAYDAFLARTSDPRLSSLASRIGKFAKLISDREIREMFSFESMLSAQ